MVNIEDEKNVSYISDIIFDLMFLSQMFDM